MSQQPQLQPQGTQQSIGQSGQFGAPGGGAFGQPTGQAGQMGQPTGQIGQPAGQMGQTTGQTGEIGRQGTRLQPQQRAALESIARAVEVCEWCADQCVLEADQNMIECIRLCEDVSEFGEAAIVLAGRNSRFAGSHLGTFQQVLRACAQECGRHPHGHCQECASVLGQTLTEIQPLVGTTGQQQMQSW
jgi:hypothetical protein